MRCAKRIDERATGGSDNRTLGVKGGRTSMDACMHGVITITNLADCCRVAWQYTRGEGKGMGLLCDLDEAIAHGYRSWRAVSDRVGKE